MRACAAVGVLQRSNLYLKRDDVHVQKFWVLETVARIPYFAYISILHLYESIGFWRAGAELRKVHFAEVNICRDVLPLMRRDSLS